MKGKLKVIFYEKKLCAFIYDWFCLVICFGDGRLLFVGFLCFILYIGGICIGFVIWVMCFCFLGGWYLL